MTDAFKMADNVLVDAVKGISDIINIQARLMLLILQMLRLLCVKYGQLDGIGPR